MLQTIKQRVLNAIPPTVLFLALFFSILYICGLQDALIATFLTLEFMRLKTDEFVESTMIKSTVLYIIIAVFAYLAGLNVYLCAVFNFVTPFMIIYLFLDEFDPTNQIPYTLALAFFQLIPTDLRGLPIRIGAIVGACIVTYIAVILTRYRRTASAFEYKIFKNYILAVLYSEHRVRSFSAYIQCRC